MRKSWLYNVGSILCTVLIVIAFFAYLVEFVLARIFWHDAFLPILENHGLNGWLFRLLLKPECSMLILACMVFLRAKIALQFAERTTSRHLPVIVIFVERCHLAEHGWYCILLALVSIMSPVLMTCLIWYIKGVIVVSVFYSMTLVWVLLVIVYGCVAASVRKNNPQLFVRRKKKEQIEWNTFLIFGNRMKSSYQIALAFLAIAIWGICCFCMALHVSKALIGNGDVNCGDDTRGLLRAKETFDRTDASHTNANLKVRRIVGAKVKAGRSDAPCIPDEDAQRLSARIPSGMSSSERSKMASDTNSVKGKSEYGF